MQPERKAFEDRDPTEAEEMAEVEAAAQRLAHSLLAVLMPANPPEPKNARVIRLFDYEATKDEVQPAPGAVQAQTREPTPREAAKAARKLSLFAAAGLVSATSSRA